MKIVLQRVKEASVTIDGEIHGAIGKGYMILVGFNEEDNHEIIDRLVEKVIHLRVFEDAITFKIALMVVKYMKYMETLEY